jgi:hypothetical protein
VAVLSDGGGRWGLRYWQICEFSLNESVGREMLAHLSGCLSLSL